MSLAALPSELLFQILEIISQSAPDDIEDIGRACRRVRLVATPLIKEHRKHLREFTKLHVNNAGAGKVFFEICRRPWVALYPRSLEVVTSKHLRTLDRAKTKKHVNLIQEFKAARDTVTTEQLESTIQSTGLIPSQEMHVWVRAIDYGDEDYLFALLLATLPSLERFTIEMDGEKMEQVKDMVRAIRREWPSRQTLPNLRTVRVEERAQPNNSDLEMFPLFAAIPGIEKMHGKSLTGMYRECYRDGWLSYPGASNSITYISLESCGMSVEGLESLMKALRNLKHFRYVFHRANWGLHAVGALLKNAHSTLETLELSTGSGSSRYMGSLRQFSALKHVTVDADMLINKGKMQRFVDLMPASLETCTIAGNVMTKNMQELFLADLFRPSFYFPYLKSIFAEDSWGKRNIGQDRLKFQKEFHKQQTTWMARYR
ncbi:uncharacterized protein KY384_007755 [Bacidia gigantensis]|uniref:uncharacterized protein n=1 Tax=Bacidia gigantensis TaxID=2732470 RepID=UPI001D05093E|nr:uncharacterized protein KY384_007755 [Bacidia gigantensis]KAG8527602.1 hypothetical protein KY384_007755 [Bacidia gigantensis]